MLFVIEMLGLVIAVVSLSFASYSLGHVNGMMKGYDEATDYVIRMFEGQELIKETQEIITDTIEIINDTQEMMSEQIEEISKHGCN